MAIVQTPNYVVWLNEHYNVYRNHLGKGKGGNFPRIPVLPMVLRVFGWSLEDDITFVVNTVGLNETNRAD